MSPQEKKFFILTDDHAREHGFRVCEFFLGETADFYYLCFRASISNPGDPDPRAWKYVEVGVGEANEIARLGLLPANFTDVLREAFATMKHPPHS